MYPIIIGELDTNKNDQDKYYRLSNFYLACFLFASGIELVNIDRTDPRHSLFVFLDSPDRESLIESFNFSKEDVASVMVDARKFIAAIKTLKDKLYQETY